MWIEPRRKPYVIGEIGFIIERTANGVATLELSPSPATADFMRPSPRTIGMGCVEATNAEGFAFVRRLGDEELSEALQEFGTQGHLPEHD